MTFGSLLFILKASEQEFQTGWFVESVLSAAMIVLAIRTRQSIFKSSASPYLTAAVFGSMIFTAFLPYTPLAKLFGFVPLPLYFYGMIGGVLILYLITVEIAKKMFFKRKRFLSGPLPNSNRRNRVRRVRVQQRAAAHGGETCRWRRRWSANVCSTVLSHRSLAARK